MLRGCGAKNLSTWRPSSFLGLSEEWGWHSTEIWEMREKRGISHIFHSTSPLEPEHLQPKQRRSSERIGQGWAWAGRNKTGIKSQTEGSLLPTNPRHPSLLSAHGMGTPGSLSPGPSSARP